MLIHRNPVFDHKYKISKFFQSDIDSRKEIFDDYSFCEIAGKWDKVGIFFHPRLRIGLMIIGPNTLVPVHRHPAFECYRILAGSALWKNDDLEWEVRIWSGQRRFAAEEENLKT